MPENAITHETLRAGQIAILDRFTAHERAFHDTIARLFEKVDKVVETNNDNRIHITAMQSSMAHMLESRAGQLAKLETMERTVAMLEKSDVALKAERGVWAAIIRSPFFAYLSAALVAAWAYFANTTGLKP